MSTDTECDRLNPALGAILDVLRERTGADLTRYRPATVTRRVVNRMIFVGAQSFEQYLAWLLNDPREALHLLERVTIKVSRFYRNAATFDVLRREVIPALQAHAAGRPLRIWSAGCGCGEEPYTLAMLLEEHGVPGHVDATELDPAALAAAEGGRYPDAAAAELPQELRARYCRSAPHGFEVADAIRGRVRFMRHDLIALVPPPGNGEAYDLVCCRNVLIYLVPGTKEQALHTVRNAVRPGGFLCLGEAEWPLRPIAPSLQPLAHKTRIFRAVASS
jgi:chemotaxis protein methyltransferase CheR/two-component system CheB/CheR fusion protein